MKIQGFCEKCDLSIQPVQYCHCGEIEFPHKHTGTNYPFKESIDPSIPGVEWEKSLAKEWVIWAKEKYLSPDCYSMAEEWWLYKLSSTLERYKREERLALFEILHEEAMKTTSVGALDLVERVQKRLTKTK